MQRAADSSTEKNPDMSLRAATTRSVRTTFAAMIVSGIMQAITLVVLARLLTPADYGLVAGALIVLTIVQRLIFGNIESAIVLQSEMSQGKWQSMFWVQFPIALTLAIAAACAALLLPIGTDFRFIALTMIPVLMISGLAFVARAKLRSDMAFGRLASIDLVAQNIGLGLVSIVAAIFGFGAMSLVLGYIAQAGLQIIGLYYYAGLDTGRGVNRSSMRPVFKTAAKLLSTSVLEVLHGQISPAFVGTFLGAQALGQYNRALSLIRLPVELVSTSMSRVLYSTFKIVRDEPAKLLLGCRTLIQTATAVTLPLCLGMAGASHELVKVILGDQWMSTSEIIPWIALGSALSTTGHLLAVMNEAVGQLGAKFAIQAITTITTALAFIVAVQHGLIGCAIAYAFAGTVFLSGQLLLSARVLKRSPIILIGWAMPSICCSVLILVSVLLVRYFFDQLSPIWLLTLEVATCGIELALFYPIFFPQLFNQMMELSGLDNVTRYFPARLRQLFR